MMLTSTFVHLPGIGPSTERRLWRDGIGTWDAFLRHRAVCGMSAERKALYDQDVTAATRALENGDARYFARCLRASEHWRLFDAFKPRILYMDIETTGASVHDGEITMVGLYRRGRMSTLLHGDDSLSATTLQGELDQADLLVTFFGSVFDVPYLKIKFPTVRFDLPHFDICFAARRLGLRGGLKHIERELEIMRDPEIGHLDGWDAVRLWHRWRTGDAASLDLLRRYNQADTENLEHLAETLYPHLIARYGPSAAPSYPLHP